MAQWAVRSCRLRSTRGGSGYIAFRRRSVISQQVVLRSTRESDGIRCKAGGVRASDQHGGTF
eukprot:3384515-Amphidinium_carterae.2